MNLAEHHAENLAKFTDTLLQSRFWHVVPEGEGNLRNAIGFLDTKRSLCYPSVAILKKFLRDHPFIFVKNNADGTTISMLHSATKLLWRAGTEAEKNTETPSHTDTEAELAWGMNKGVASLGALLKARLNEISNEPVINDKLDQLRLSLGRFPHGRGKQIVQKGRWGGLANWRLPTKDQLVQFAKDEDNPLRSPKEDGLLTSRNKSTNVWLTANGVCDLARDSAFFGAFHMEHDPSGALLPVNKHWEGVAAEQILIDLCERGWYLLAPNNQAFIPDQRFLGLSIEKLQAALVVERNTLISAQQADLVLNPSALWIDTLLSELDYIPCRLPVLNDSQLTDPEKGLWELWGDDKKTNQRYGVIARDPGRDIQHRAVAIDFGTSSTVVACETSSGGRELLRIGVRDFYQAVQPQHFENPTVLECLDFASFQKAWTSQAYRPELNWNWMRAAHEAQASFRDNPGDTRILASILPRLKQLALRSKQQQIVFSDRSGKEIELPAHGERNPIRGQALQVGEGYPFDPIELYAWYLGMAINWRGRGLFLKYYLSFPVKYPREVREKILASFRIGLQRSLPHSLISHYPHVLNEFEVNDLASEPAAYAAAALEFLGIKPDDTGVPYAVFDFGGGTTDFDFGLLRWANDEEDAAGYEQVFEHLASSGDNFLGGENLLEYLVYETFRHNLDVLRTGKIQFTLPLGIQAFPGSEAFIARTQAAQTNTVMLAARLRNFMEDDTPRLDPQIKLDLIDANGHKHTCELALDAERLDNVLAERTRYGVAAFLAELAKVQPKLPPGVPIHVLLAGNGSRSRHVCALFDQESEQWSELLHQALGGDPPEIIIHPPLPIDDQNPHAPTSKTGVALGLLRVSPGRNVLLKNHVHANHDGQAPFAWYIGRLRRGQLEPTLTPDISYGEWKALGVLQSGVFYLYATTSPRANTGMQEGDPELMMHRLDFPAAPSGARVFARAVAPYQIDVTAVLESDDPSSGEIRQLQL